VLNAIPSPASEALEIGPLSFRFYGLAIALGVLAAVWLTRRRWGAIGGDPEDVTSVAIVAVPAGLVGARVYHVLTDWGSRYSGGRWWPDAFEIWSGGLGIPGGVVGGTLAAVWMAHRLGLPWRRLADAAAPALPLAQAIGRLGNWFNQELFGRPTQLPWGLRIDAEHRPQRFPDVELFHPTFAYEALWNLALASLIIVMSRRVVLRPGRWFAAYVTGYGLGRLWVESLRIDDATQLLGLRVNIWTSLVAVSAGVIWLFWKGMPVDREATSRLGAGASPAEIAALPPSRSELERAMLAASSASLEADEHEDLTSDG
jgi:prolipoprotein diacylglyceryl transferase